MQWNLTDVLQWSYFNSFVWLILEISVIFFIGKYICFWTKLIHLRVNPTYSSALITAFKLSYLNFEHRSIVPCITAVVRYLQLDIIAMTIVDWFYGLNIRFWHFCPLWLTYCRTRFITHFPTKFNVRFIFCPLLNPQIIMRTDQ